MKRRDTFKKGDMVNYHSLIGGEITSKGHVIEMINRAPNNFGCDVAWISDKAGCVAIDALSNFENPMTIEIPKRLTRSEKRYKDYLHSETDETFFEWLKRKESLRNALEESY